MPAHKITTKYFLEEYSRFRGIMCSTEYDMEQKLEAYKGLFFVYVNIDPDVDSELCKGAMEALDLELNMRLGYEAMLQIANIVEECQGERS